MFGVHYSRDSSDIIDIKNTIFNPSTMLIVKPQCILFDKDWNRVEEVFEFLEQRKNTKRQAWNTIESKARALKLFYDFLEETKMPYYSITAREINDFIAWLFKDDEKYSLGKLTKRTARTVNNYISHVRDFYTYHSYINNINNPFDGEIELINRPSSMGKGFYEHTLSSGKVIKIVVTVTVVLKWLLHQNFYLTFMNCLEIKSMSWRIKVCIVNIFYVKFVLR